MTERVLVTGASGFLGSHVATALGEAGFDVVGTTSSGRDGADGVDLTDPDAARSLLTNADPDAIVHCAGAIGSQLATFESLLRLNVLMMQVLLDATARRPKLRMLVASSSSVYAPSNRLINEDALIEPVTPYGIAKASQELVARAASARGQQVTSLRFFNLIGPGQSTNLMLSALVRQIADGEASGSPSVRVNLGRLDSRRDFVDVRDAARAVALLAPMPDLPLVMNVATGHAIPVADCVEIAKDVATVRVEVVSTAGHRSVGEITSQAGDASRLSTLTGWRPTVSLRQTIEDLFDYWRRQAQRSDV